MNWPIGNRAWRIPCSFALFRQRLYIARVSRWPKINSFRYLELIMIHDTANNINIIMVDIFKYVIRIGSEIDELFLWIFAQVVFLCRLKQGFLQKGRSDKRLLERREREYLPIIPMWIQCIERTLNQPLERSAFQHYWLSCPSISCVAMFNLPTEWLYILLFRHFILEIGINQDSTVDGISSLSHSVCISRQPFCFIRKSSGK